MKRILSICLLVLLISRKVKGDTTLRPTVVSQNEGTSKGHGPSTRGEETSMLATNHNGEHGTEPRPEDSVFSSKQNLLISQQQLSTEENKSPSHTSSFTIWKGHQNEDHSEEHWTSTTKLKNEETGITEAKMESPSHLSLLTTLRRQSQRSLEYSQDNHTPSKSAKQPDITTGHEQTSQLRYTEKNAVTDNSKNSSENIFNSRSNHTSNFQITQAVTTNEVGKVSAVSQTYMQKTMWSTQAQETKGTNVLTTDSPILHSTNSNLPLTTSKGQTPPNTTPATRASTMEVTSAVNSFMTSTGYISTEIVPTTIPTTFIKTESKIDTRGMTTDKKTSTTTLPSKTMPNKRHSGSIVASLIGSILILMFIAIIAILIRKRSMQKKQQETPDWAGPSPFLEGDAQPNQSCYGEDKLFQQRDSKRISLHSFLPQRASQRLSMLVEEEVVQMNDIALSSTFGRSEQPQNGKPAVEKDKFPTEIVNEGLAPDVPSDSVANEMVTVTANPVINVNIQNPKPDDTITPPSSETNASLQPAQSFEDVNLDPLQSNTVFIPPAPPIP